MSLLDDFKLEKIDTNVDKTEFVMVVIPHVIDTPALVDYEGFSIETDVREGGLTAEDMGFGPTGTAPGLWIGEGVPVWVPTGSMDGYPGESETEATYDNFTWRRPTSEEMEALNNEGLWGKRKRCLHCGEYLTEGEELILQVKLTPEDEPSFQKFCTECYEKELDK